MRILFLTHKFNPDIGGIESVSEMLADEFCQQGHTVRILTWSEQRSTKQFEYEVIRKPNLKSILKEMRLADIIFENNPCLRLSWPNLFMKRPLVVALHTWIRNVNRKVGLQQKLKFNWLQKADRVIACSEAIRKGTFPAAVTIGNPYDNETFVVDKNVKRNKDYVFLGRLVSDKGVNLAVEALRIALEKEPQLFRDSTFTIIGEGPEKLALDELVSLIGLQHKIFFSGSKTGTALVQLLNEHKYILVPSLWQEPFGIVALEGIACGCIPIVAQNGGLPDAVGAAGEIFESGNAYSLADRMIYLKSSPDHENRLRDAAPAHLQKHISKSVAQQYLLVLKSAADAHKNRLH